MPTEIMTTGAEIADLLNARPEICRELGLLINSDALEAIAEKAGRELDVETDLADTIENLSLDEEDTVMNVISDDAVFRSIQRNADMRGAIVGYLAADGFLLDSLIELMDKDAAFLRSMVTEMIERDMLTIQATA